MIRLAWAIPTASLIAALAIGFLLGHWFSGAPQPAASVLADSFPPCRQDPLVHVRRPTRFVVVSNCASVSGTVRRVEFQLHDGDYRVFVDPDPQYAHVLTAGNNGLLVAEIIPVDQPSVFLPTVGQHATFYGALVLDRGHDRWAEIHPTWLITTLDVSVTVPPSARVGDVLSIAVDVASTTDGNARSAPEANVFLELIREDGSAVRWESARTNTLGVANVQLASLESPGTYTLLVHASRDQQSGIGKATFKIRRR